jgi:uncharacterized protein (DUF305 family)
MTLPSDSNMTRRIVLALAIPATLLALSGCGTTQLPPSPAATPAISVDRGLDFDRSFIDGQIASHQELLDREEMLLGTPGQNPQLVALAKEGTENLRQNLAALRTIQRKLPPSSAAMPAVWPPASPPAQVSASVR